MNPFPSIFTINTEKFQNLDVETRNRYLSMLNVVPEPNWLEEMVKTLSFLKCVRENLIEQDQGAAMMRVSNVVEMLDHMLTSPKVAGAAFEFVEHNRKAVDIIALEQMMSLEQESSQMNLFDEEQL